MAAEYDLGAAFDAFVLGTSDSKNARKQPPLQKNVASSIGYRIVKAEDILDERTSKVEQQKEKPIPVQNPLDNQKENLPKAQERAAHIQTRGSGFALADSDVFLQTKAAQDDRDNIAKPDYGTENVPPHQDPPQHAEQRSDCFALTSADDFLKVKARQDTHLMLRGQSHVPLPPPSPRSKASSPYSALQSKLEALSPPTQDNGRYAGVTTAPTKPPKATPEQTLQQRQHSNIFGQTSNANAQVHHKTTAQANPSTRVVSHVRERQVQAEMAARNAPPPAWDAASANNTKSPPQNYKTTRMIQAQKKGRQPGPIDIYQPSPSDSFFLVKRTSQEDYLGVFTIYKRAVDTAADFVRRTTRVKTIEIIDTNQVPDFFPANIAYRKTDPDGHSATIFQRAASEIVTVKVMPKPFSSQKVQPGSGGTVYLGLVSSEHGLMVTGICGTHDEAWASCGETCSRIRKSAPFTEYQKARRDSNGMMFVNGQIVNKEYYFFVRPYILDRPVGMD